VAVPRPVLSLMLQVGRGPLASHPFRGHPAPRPAAPSDDAPTNFAERTHFPLPTPIASIRCPKTIEPGPCPPTPSDAVPSATSPRSRIARSLRPPTSKNARHNYWRTNPFSASNPCSLSALPPSVFSAISPRSPWLCGEAGAWLPAERTHFPLRTPAPSAPFPPRFSLRFLRALRGSAVRRARGSGVRRARGSGVRRARGSGVRRARGSAVRRARGSAVRRARAPHQTPTIPPPAGHAPADARDILRFKTFGYRIAPWMK
jgi:hypothetical protein